MPRSHRILTLLAALVMIARPLWPGQAAAPAQDPKDALIARLAIDVARDYNVPPIPLDAGGGPVRGVAYDQFRLTLLAARSTSAPRTSPDLAPPPNARKLMIVAFPVADRNGENPPQDVRLLDAERRPVERLSHTCGRELAKDLPPGVTSPPLACTATFDRAGLRPGDAVEITYEGAVEPGAPKTISLAVQIALPRKVHDVTPHMPPNEPVPDAPVVVRVEALIDLDGNVRYPRIVSGPQPFGDAAVETVRQWRFEPARTNGAVIPVVATLTVTYAPRR